VFNLPSFKLIGRYEFLNAAILKQHGLLRI